MPGTKAGARGAGAKKKGAGGRPSGYKPEFAKQAEKLCKLGATDSDLADFFEVTDRTIYNWQTAHPEFFRALKVGKEVADARVERSLYHRAIGYSHEDVHVSNYQGKVTLTPIRKHYPPDTTAGIFWLKARQGWRENEPIEGKEPEEVASRLVAAVRAMDAQNT